MSRQSQRPGLGAPAIEVVSGGQTGVDRAALDAAIELGVKIGGWCPRGRRAEDGIIPSGYSLTETPRADYYQRTEWNVRDSDATLILYRHALTGGTALTAELTRQLERPLLARDLLAPLTVEAVIDWLIGQGIHRLNCAGPRESGAPGIYDESKRRFLAIFSGWLDRLADPRAEVD